VVTMVENGQQFSLSLPIVGTKEREPPGEGGRAKCC
jgi:hypothetical protein